jgi:cytochrome c peroxidase
VKLPRIFYESCRSLKLAVLCLAAVNLTGCMNSSSSSLDEQLRSIISAQGLTGDPSTGKAISDINDPLPQLGMKLFFSKALGGDKDSACVTCHHPTLGGGDNLSLSIGSNAVEPDLLGPGRLHRPDVANYDGGPTVPRNAPSTFNVALYTRGMFWDSRVEKIDGGIFTPASPELDVPDPDAVDIVSAQARFPVTSAAEMRGLEFEKGNPMSAVWAHLEARLGNYSIGTGELLTSQWASEFESVYGPAASTEELITFDRIVEAIGAYERSQVFIDNPWKSYVEGDNEAISSAAKRGALLFFRPQESGGAGCALCHSGDFLSDESFHTIATPQIGRGRGDGPTGDNDFGRYRVTGAEVDKFAFRTPSLLNVEVTGPWGHAGAYTSLEQIVRHYRDPADALHDYDYSQLDPSVQVTNTATNTQAALDKIQQDLQAGRLTVRNVALSDQEVSDLVAFLLTLTDPCVKSRDCLAPWIPDDTDIDPDDLRLRAYDQDGNLL